MAQSGVCHPEKQGNARNDHSDGRPSGHGDSLVVEPCGHREREDQAQDEQRLDQHEGAPSECEELEEIADAVESVADEPPGAACEMDEEPEAHRQPRRFPNRCLMLEH